MDIRKKDVRFGFWLLLLAIASNVLVEYIMEGNINSLVNLKFIVVAILVCTGGMFAHRQLNRKHP